MNFKDYIKEATKKPGKPEKPEETTAVMAFGRFNPPTVGHEKLIQKVQQTAAQHKDATGHIFASHSQGTLKDPLPQDKKLTYLHSVVPGNIELHGSSKEKPSIFHAAAKMHAKGHKHLVIVAGSYRVEEYKKNLDKYNDGKEYPHGKYKFKSIKVISAGQRDPDSEGVEGMSGTKMREHARTGNIEKFRSGLPDVLKAHAEEISKHIRTVKEDYENPYRFDDATPEGTEYMMKLTPGQKPECRDGGIWSEKLGTCVPIREAYMGNEIFRLNDIVEAANGDRGPIVYRGASYVTIQIGEGKTVKHWLKDIKEHSSVLPISIPKVHTKVREQQIPALFMSKEQLAERAKGSMELSYNGYQTEYLHMCPGASDQLHELIKNKELNPKYVLQAIQASDKYLELEKEAQSNGFADDQMVHDFNMYLAIAHDTLNMLGYPDKKLEYMSNHIKIMSDLSMHKDGTFANETQNTVPTFGSEDTSEGFNSADYKIVVGKDGKKHKVRAYRVITDKEQNQVRETLTMSKFKKKIAETYAPDPETAKRDVNLSSDKEVYHGIDKTIADQGHEGKPPGFVSFKSFMATPETQKIENDKGQAMQDVHRAKAELSVHTSAYKLMRKAHQQDN